MGGREIIGEDDARRLAAHAAFEAYDFGEAVVAATGSWNFEPVAGAFEASVRCFLEQDVGGEGVVNFAVRFEDESDTPSDVRTLLARSGESIGFWPGNAAPAP